MLQKNIQAIVCLILLSTFLVCISSSCRQSSSTTTPQSNNNATTDNSNNSNESSVVKEELSNETTPNVVELPVESKNNLGNNTNEKQSQPILSDNIEPPISKTTSTKPESESSSKLESIPSEKLPIKSESESIEINKPQKTEVKTEPVVESNEDEKLPPKKVVTETKSETGIIDTSSPVDQTSPIDQTSPVDQTTPVKQETPVNLLKIIRFLPSSLNAIIFLDDNESSKKNEQAKPTNSSNEKTEIKNSTSPFNSIPTSPNTTTPPVTSSTPSISATEISPPNPATITPPATSPTPTISATEISPPNPATVTPPATSPTPSISATEIPPPNPATITPLVTSSTPTISATEIPPSNPAIITPPATSPTPTISATEIPQPNPATITPLATSPTPTISATEIPQPNPTIITPLATSPTPTISATEMPQPNPATITPPVISPTPTISATEIPQPNPAIITPPATSPTPPISATETPQPNPAIITPPVISPTPTISVTETPQPNPATITPPAISPTPSINTTEIPQPNIDNLDPIINVTENINAEKRLRFSFKFAAWKDVINWFAEQANLSLQVDNVPSGTLNLTDNNYYTPTEALDILNSYLLFKEYTLIRKGQTLFVINLVDGIPPIILDPIMPDELDNRGKYEICRCVFPLVQTTPDVIQNEVEKLLGPQGSIIALPTSRHIVITETGGTLRAIRSIIRQIDGAGNIGAGSIHVIEVKSLPADDALAMMRRLLGIDEANTTLQTIIDSTGTKILASGRGDMIERAKAMLKTIDESFSSGESFEKPQFRTYATGVADPTTTLLVLQTLLAGKSDVRLSLDTKTGGIAALGRPADHETIRSAIRELQINMPIIEVIPLRRLNPIGAVDAIKKFFATSTPTSTSTNPAMNPAMGNPAGGVAINPNNPNAPGAMPNRPGQPPRTPAARPTNPAANNMRATTPTTGVQNPTVEADVAGRRIVVRGTKQQILEIRILLEKLGEDPEYLKSQHTSKTRTVSISPTATALVLEQLQELWPKMGQNELRIITPDLVIPTKTTDDLRNKNKPAPQLDERIDTPKNNNE
ncbi:MAG: hypothetical protein LBH59_04420, partial [Planctomycetaceae bacterium]|nr:hypothetical protein [Planctomycetaceae bacterium]